MQACEHAWICNCNPGNTCRCGRSDTHGGAAQCCAKACRHSIWGQPTCTDCMHQHKHIHSKVNTWYGSARQLCRVRLTCGRNNNSCVVQTVIKQGYHHNGVSHHNGISHHKLGPAPLTTQSGPQRSGTAPAASGRLGWGSGSLRMQHNTQGTLCQHAVKVTSCSSEWNSGASWNAHSSIVRSKHNGPRILWQHHGSGLQLAQHQRGACQLALAQSRVTVQQHCNASSSSSSSPCQITPSEHGGVVRLPW